MAINNEELMGKFVRTGMIMRHIDGEEAKGHKRGHGHGHGHGAPEGHEGHGAPEGHEGHGPHGEGKCGHGHGHEKGHGKGKCGRRRGQERVLTMVSMKEGINQKDLAFLLGIRPQTLGEMLQKLEERGMVERKKSEADGRVIEVTLTDKGRERAAEIAERRAVAAADMFAVLTEEEKEQLGAILDKLAGELDKYRPRHWLASWTSTVRVIAATPSAASRLKAKRPRKTPNSFRTGLGLKDPSINPPKCAKRKPGWMIPARLFYSKETGSFSVVPIVQIPAAIDTPRMRS